jgi:hypothetical protein
MSQLGLDCILERLDKHSECPCCRVNMVTEGEMNKAADSLAGKTRVYKAVASLNATAIHRADAQALRGSPPTPRIPP